MNPDMLPGLQEANDELTAAIRAAARDLIMGGLPALLGVVGLIGMIRQRRQVRRALAEAVAAAPEEVGADEALQEGVVRIKLALPEWARLEQEPGGRWVVIDTATAVEGDTLVGAEIIAVLSAPVWASACSDDELRNWAERLEHFRRGGGCAR